MACANCCLFNRHISAVFLKRSSKHECSCWARLKPRRPVTAYFITGWMSEAMKSRHHRKAPPKSKAQSFLPFFPLKINGLCWWKATAKAPSLHYSHSRNQALLSGCSIGFHSRNVICAVCCLEWINPLPHTHTHTLHPHQLSAEHAAVLHVQT